MQSSDRAILAKGTHSLSHDSETLYVPGMYIDNLSPPQQLFKSRKSQKLEVKTQPKNTAKALQPPCLSFAGISLVRRVHDAAGGWVASCPPAASPGHRCRANMAHTRQSRPVSERNCNAKDHKTFLVVASPGVGAPHSSSRLESNE